MKAVAVALLRGHLPLTYGSDSSAFATTSWSPPLQSPYWLYLYITLLALVRPDPES